MDNDFDILRAEGLGYFEDQIKEIGGFSNDFYEGVYAIHSKEGWGTVHQKVKNLGMFWFLFDRIKLIKETKMKDGNINYVFRCE